MYVYDIVLYVDTIYLTTSFHFDVVLFENRQMQRIRRRKKKQIQRKHKIENGFTHLIELPCTIFKLVK